MVIGFLADGTVDIFKRKSCYYDRNCHGNFFYSGTVYIGVYSGRIGSHTTHSQNVPLDKWDAPGREVLDNNGGYITNCQLIGVRTIDDIRADMRCAGEIGEFKLGTATNQEITAAKVYARMNIKAYWAGMNNQRTYS